MEETRVSVVWDNRELLDSLQETRIAKRLRSGRLSFDCFNLVCRGDRVHCAKGKLLSPAKDGSMPLISALRGLTSGVCKTCEYYEGEEENNG